MTNYVNAPQVINEARAKVLIGNRNPDSNYQTGDTLVIQYRTEFGLVIKETDTWGESATYSLLRYA